MPLSTIFQLYRGGIDKKNLEKKKLDKSWK